MTRLIDVEFKTMIEEDIRALTALVVGNHDLDHLESLLSGFNLFEAIGAVRQELRHSDFLAFLLNPRESHGLGDVFVKRLLQTVLAPLPVSSVTVSPVELDLCDLGDALVLREWENIDLLFADDRNRLALLVENKVDSGEHDDQLRRYLEIAQREYPRFRMIALFLTPGGDPPSDESYIAVSYATVCDVLDSIIQARGGALQADVLLAVKHYVQMVRRHIVEESEIADLCRRIYQKHQRALDLIYEHRPDRQSGVARELVRLIRETPELVIDTESKAAVRFCPAVWDSLPMLLSGSGWTASHRMLLFEFTNNSQGLKLKLIIGPGPQETRQRLFEMAQQHQSLFRLPARTLSPVWNQIYGALTFISSKSYEESAESEIMETVGKHWSKFIAGDLGEISQCVMSALVG